ncbi:hypothetical protein FA048_19395 [Pedobacter polaris]|uniref:Tail specific protease domain-containing protein n=1 Tax=Pedobacter polaris TaxID=2571273 RepID=A0A4U1CCS5_9SPHI|nr:S41 family peptidase [Pedobacter polaris]TKC04628.1 hypothetical protein FA048_19395 [Pedobacter polaris]
MRKFILKTISSLIIISYLGLPTCLANETQQTLAQNKNIESFIKVWGIVKYRSPISIAGKFDADKVFLTNIEQIKNADQKEFNRLVLQILVKADSGVVNSHNKTKPKLINIDILTKNVDYKWINDNQYSRELKSKLKLLANTLNQTEEHHYINKVSYESVILNEPAYVDYNTFNDETINLLALAKSWCAIEYLFAYKYKMDKNNLQILTEMVPVFRKINARASYERAVLMLENKLNDTHASGFLNQIKSKATVFKIGQYPPFDYQCFESGILVKAFFSDSLEKFASLKKGDLIVEINKIKIKDWLNKRMELLPASNMAVKYRLLSFDWSGNAYAFYDLQDAVLNVKVLRKGKLLFLKIDMLNLQRKNSLEIINQYIKKNVQLDDKIKPYEDLGDSIAIIRGGYFFNKDLPQNEAEELDFSKKLKSKKALIFDMRKYPNGGLFYYFIPMALGKTSFEFARYYQANLKDPGTFYRLTGMEIYLSKDLKHDDHPYKGKIIILTNENTQSRGEWYSMLLRQLNKNTTVIGSQTAGTDGDLKLLNIPGGYQFVFTGNGIFYPDGKETQRIGIVPDILYQPSFDDILDPTDAQLKRAEKYINEGK